MADLRCPMCAKMNPDTLDECQFCGARLKPLVLPQTGALKLPSDWDKPKAQEPSPAPDSPKPSDSDWLKRLRSEDAASPSPFTQTASLPDWLGMNDEASAEPEQAAPGPGVDDWLSRLRGQDAASLQQAEEPEPLSEDLLRSRLGGLGDAPPAEPEADAPAELPAWLKPQSSASAESDDDWLKSLGSEPQQPAQMPGLSDFARMAAAPPPQEEESDDDWLKSFGVESAEPPKPRGFSNLPSTSAAAEPAANDVDDSNDWLKSFGAEPESPKPQPGLSDFARMAAAPPPQEEDDSDDWLKSFGVEQTPAEQPAEPGLPDWLKVDESKPLPPAAEQPLQQTASLPDWLGTTSEAATPAPPAGDVKDDAADWLKSLSGASALAASSDSSALPAELPAWLSNLTPGSAPPLPQPPSAGTPDTLDWLQAEESSTPTPPAAERTPTADLPDWLNKLTSSSAPPSAQPPSALSRTATLDWLGGSQSAESSDAGLSAELPAWLQPSPPAAQSALPSDMPEPDWVISANDEPKAEPARPPSLQKSTGMMGQPHSAADTFSMQSPTGTGPALVGSDAEVQGWLKDLEASAPAAPEPASGDQLPDWLNQLRPSESSAPAIVFDTGEQPPASAGSASGDLPDWLASLRPSGLDVAPPFAVESDKAEAFKPGNAPAEMPAWLAPAAGVAATITSASPFTEPIEGASANNADLARGSLPAWLQAMRPINLNAPTIDLAPDYEETAGPLAGMRGILPAESAITVPGKPGAVVTRFVVSDAEAQQAELFRSIVSEETQESVVAGPKRKPRFNYPVDRLLVALVLLAAALAPYALGALVPDLFAPPSSLPAPGEALYKAIDELPVDQPVLIAFEYEPASVGELNPGVEAVMAHLLRRSVPVAVTSTSPAGAGLAQEVLSRVVAQAGLAPEDANKKYIYLGYIPGGASGLQQFALKLPAEAIARGYGNFSLIIVATSSSESAQAWLEQVQPVAGVKLAAIASAAAEPMLYPYYKSDQKQLVGLVSGLSGGLLYGAKSGKAAPPEQWNAYAYSLNAAGAILTLGAVAGVVMLLLNRRPAQPSAARAKAVSTPEDSAEPQSELKRRSPKSKKPRAGKSSKAKKK